VIFSEAFLLSLVMFYQNLCSFFYSKPPLCVFLLSLLSFSIITFSLSIYVQHNDRVANIDVLDWNRLLLEMSELKYCLCRDKCHCQESVHLNEGAMLGTRVRRDLNQASVNNKSSAALASIPIKTRLLDQLKIKEETFRGTGVVPLDHFGLGHDPTAKVAVTIHQQKQFQDKLCVVVEGDKKHLEAIVNSSATSEGCPGGASLGGTTTLCVHSASHLPHAWCQNGTRFEIDYDEQEEWVTHLSAQERAIVHIHLMATAAFLFTIVIFMAGFAAFRGSMGARTMTSKNVGDARGDMELLSTSQDD